MTSGFSELDTLVPAYASTIHKNQGSEYPAVVLPILTQHYAMLQRNLLYTGITRGKRLVVLVGQKKAVAIAVRNVTFHTEMDVAMTSFLWHAAKKTPCGSRLLYWTKRCA